MPVVDLRPLPPPERHATVHRELDALAPGETLELVNDHKPDPLRHEIEAERPGEYSWTDGQDGPDVFTATITCLARIVDVRPLIARGEEPFATIMAAVDQLEDGQDLVVIVPFEPVPLEGVLSGQGFSYNARQIGDDWRVTFHREV